MMAVVFEGRLVGVDLTLSETDFFDDDELPLRVLFEYELPGELAPALLSIGTLALQVLFAVGVDGFTVIA